MPSQFQTTCRWIRMFCLPATRPLMVNSTGLRELALSSHFSFQIGSSGQWKHIQLLCSTAERVSHPFILQKSINAPKPNPERPPASLSANPFSLPAVWHVWLEKGRRWFPWVLLDEHIWLFLISWVSSGDLQGWHLILLQGTGPTQGALQ